MDLGLVNTKQFRAMYASGIDKRRIAAEFKISYATLDKISDALALPRNRFVRQIPTDLAETLARLGVEGSRVHYGTGKNTFERWLQATGLKSQVVKLACARRGTVEVPDDWAAVAPTLYKTELQDRYNLTRNRVNKLIEVTGVQPRKCFRQLAAERPPAAPNQVRGGRSDWRGYGTSTLPLSALSDHSDTGIAARFLRRHYGSVHKCDIQMVTGSNRTWGDVQGVPNHGRGYYNVAGVGVVTDKELIALAARRGFA